MKKTYRTMTTRLAAALLGLLLTAPGAGAQNRTGAPGPSQLPGTGQTSPTILAGATGTLAPLISNKIQFHGQVPATNINYRADPLDVCPNAINYLNQGIQSQPYQFEFESNCLGNNSSTRCRFRPNFIWTIKYFTEAGNSYTEQWQDRTSGDFSKVRLYLYDQVPYANTPTNGQATQAGGNQNFSAVPYPNTGCLNPPSNTAQPGDLITHVRLECTGYSCGNLGGDDSDAITIRYYGRRPAAITVGSPQPLCRNAPIPISASPVFAATSYLWYTSGLYGAVISNVNGNNATLDVSGVPAGTNIIYLRVAAQDNAHCGGITSFTQELAVNIAQALPAPQNMQLSNGRCVTTSPTDTKLLSVDGVSNALAGGYKWELTDNTAGAVFDDGTTVCNGCARSVSIRTPNSGQFTATVRAAVTDCGGVTATLSQAFSVSSSIPATVSAVDFPGGLCLGGRSYPLVLRDPEPGVVYSLSVSNVQPNTASINFVQNSGGQPSGQIAIVNGTPTSFDVRVFAVGSCPPVTAVNFPPIRVPLGPAYCYSALEEPRTAPVVTLYPNPTNGLVSVQANESARYEWVKVTDVQGRLVLEQHAAGAEGISRFDLSKAPMGIYEVQLFDGKRLTQKRISKE